MVELDTENRKVYGSRALTQRGVDHLAKVGCKMNGILVLWNREGRLKEPLVFLNFKYSYS